MVVEGFTPNATVYHHAQLYWIILLQSNTQFTIHSLMLNLSSIAARPAAASILIDLATEGVFDDNEVPLYDLSHICIESFNQRRFSKTFYCHNSPPRFQHKIVIYHLDYRDTEYVSMKECVRCIKQAGHR